MSIFFTSDQHFGHENIIKFCNRPFGDVAHMDDWLVERWNDAVKPCDEVYHLGDFTLGDIWRARSYFKRLNGIIRVLRNQWHHDRRWMPKAGDVVSQCGNAQGVAVGLRPPMVVLEFPEYGNGKYPKAVVLCHYPIAEWDRRHHGAWHLHGHSHGNHHSEGKILDVGVDSPDFAGYAPVSLEQVAEIMATRLF